MSNGKENAGKSYEAKSEGGQPLSDPQERLQRAAAILARAAIRACQAQAGREEGGETRNGD